MKLKSRFYVSVAAVAIAAFLNAASAPLMAQQAAGAAVHVGANDLGGVVTGAAGPEAGVWVIAETRDLPTRYAKVVVTDDQGRFVIPDLPKAKYQVWVRGYGLVDSPRVKAAPGQTLALKAVIAPSDKAAAQYYPGVYWYSLLKMPPASDFPGTGSNGISTSMKTQHAWIDTVKNG